MAVPQVNEDVQAEAGQDHRVKKDVHAEAGFQGRQD
jgi:hypothetical protein